MSLRSIMNNLGADLSFDEESLRSMLDSCNSIIKVSGTYRYRQPSEDDYGNVCDIIRSSLNVPLIDVRDEYSKHSEEYRRLDLRSHFELASMLNRFFPDSSTTMGLSFRSEVILNKIQMPRIGMVGSITDREDIQAVLSKCPSEYISLETFYSMYRESCKGRKLVKSDVDAILNSMPSVLRRQGMYRPFSMDTATLTRLMMNAADSIPFERADCGQIYHAVIVEAKSMGIRDSDELYQILRSSMPKSMSSKVGEIKLSHFRECTIKDGDSFDDNDSHMDLDVEDYVKTLLNSNRRTLRPQLISYAYDHGIEIY